MMVQLLPHQLLGMTFLAQRNVAMLWDEAGTGKTATVVVGAQRAGHRRCLVLCPAAVRRAWEHEIIVWSEASGLPVPDIAVIEGSQGPFLPETAPGWTIMSHEALVSNPICTRLWQGQDWDLLVVDEHSAFRRFEARRTRNLLGDSGLWTMARAVWMLDGDPVVNSSMDLYPLFYGPIRQHLGAVPPAWEFGLQYATWLPDGRNGYRAIGVKNEDDLALRLLPFVLRRTLASANIELPMLDIRRHRLLMTQDVLAEVTAALANWSSEVAQARFTAMLESREDVRDTDIARARHALGIAKAPYVAQHVLGMAARRELPVVVFFQHTMVREILAETLAGRGLRVGWLDGQVSRKVFGDTVVLYGQGGLDVLLVQIQAGGRGLTLTRGNRVVIAELPWTAVALHQAIKRVHRMTQNSDVVADVLVADQWLDEALATTIRRKDEASKRLMDLVTS